VKRCSFIALALLALACSSSAATAGAKNVRIESADPPNTCESIGTITAYASNTGNDDETVRAKLRDQAAATGANYVRLDKLGGTRSLKEYSGTAYKCPPGP
jgi:ABC-type glycerol-3-phosphate transport system substrate-binding protein